MNTGLDEKSRTERPRRRPGTIAVVAGIAACALLLVRVDPVSLARGHGTYWRGAQLALCLVAFVAGILAATTSLRRLLRGNTPADGARGGEIGSLLAGMAGAMMGLLAFALMAGPTGHPQFEVRAAAALKTYANAQVEFKEGSYSRRFAPEKDGWFATSIEQLCDAEKGIEALPQEMVSATSPETALHGYYLVPGPVTKDSFVLFAAPAVYDWLSRETLCVTEDLVVWGKDLGGRPPAPEERPSEETGWSPW